MDLALEAVAKIAHIDMERAVKFVRKQPLFDQEIHIEEELINLDEAFRGFHIAVKTLEKYPTMRYHAVQERRAILQHCIGLISRMKNGQTLPRSYTDKDTDYAMHKLVSLMIKDAKKLNYQIDENLIEILKPYMTWQQRLAYGGTNLNPLAYLKPIISWLPFTD